MDEDDFLWKIALDAKENGVYETVKESPASVSDKFVIPEKNTFTMPLHPHIGQKRAPIIVKLYERRGHGVFDPVGLSIWEASYLLCVYLTTNYSPDELSNAHEIGAGMGLPTILLATLFKRLMKGCNLIATDHDLSVLETLNYTFTSFITPPHHIPVSQQNLQQPNILSSQQGITLTTRHLDWRDFHFHGNTIGTINNTFESYESTIIFGAALVYSTDVAEYLAATIVYLLEKTPCKEVAIVQIKDRVGFDDFMTRLSQVPNIVCNIEPIPEAIYEAAQQISLVNSEIVTTPSRFCSDDDCFECENEGGMININSTMHTEDVLIKKDIYFPPCVFLSSAWRNKALGNNEEDLDEGSSSEPILAHQSSPSRFHGLLTTPRESFCLLKISLAT